MNHSDNNSSMRYLLARLKPFGRITFWGPLGILSLGLIFYWQYQQHPEWLTQVNGQPETLDNYFRSRDIPTEASSVTAPNAPNAQPAPATTANTPNAPAEDSNWATEWKNQLSDQQVLPYSVNNSKNLNRQQQTNTAPQANQTSSLFRPLLPPVRTNTQPPTAIRPYQVPQAAPISENYLRTAVEQIPTSNPSSYYNTNIAPVNTGQPLNPPVTGYAAPPPAAVPNYQSPSYGTTYARPLPPQPYTAPGVNQQPANPSGVVIQGNPPIQSGYQIQPSINSRTGGF